MCWLLTLCGTLSLVVRIGFVAQVVRCCEGDSAGWVMTRSITKLGRHVLKATLSLISHRAFFQSLSLFVLWVLPLPKWGKDLCPASSGVLQGSAQEQEGFEV